MSRLPALASMVVGTSFVVFLARPAEAATPPGGSYKQSCLLPRFNGTTLRAFCATGIDLVPTVLSSLRTAGCTGDISNVNGHLYCPGGVPGGSYFASCTDAVLQWDGTYLNQYLTATCSDGLGNWTQSTLHYSLCIDEPTNILGGLSCSFPYDPPPGGSYRVTCRMPGYNGYYLAASCRAGDGTWHDTSITNPTTCTRDIANINGVLTCVK